MLLDVFVRLNGEHVGGFCEPYWGAVGGFYDPQGCSASTPLVASFCSS